MSQPKSGPKSGRQSESVTLINDPWMSPELDVADAQNESEYVEINDEAEISDAPDSTSLDRLESAMQEEEARQSKILEAEAQATEIQNQEDSKKLLADQIAEDQALAQAEAQAQDAAAAQAEAALEIHFAALDLSEVESYVEAVLFVSDKPLSLDKLRGILGETLPLDRLREALDGLQMRYQGVQHGIELVKVAGGYQIRTKPGRSTILRKLAKVQTQRLSTGAMETLALISYRQPVMKEEIDQVRGVDSSYFIRGLLDKKLIKISGRSELPGRPMLYATTQEFLELFGLAALDDLPSLREIENMIPASESDRPRSGNNLSEDEQDPRIRKMRELVHQMKADPADRLGYDPEEDEKLLAEIRERVKSIPTTTPFIEAEKQAKQDLESPEPKLPPSSDF